MKKPEFYLDENLRFRPQNLAHLNEFIQYQHDHLKTLQDPQELVRAYGELGVNLRQADRFSEAEDVLKKALEIVAEKNLGVASEVQQKIRLAHVYQEQRNFAESNALFEECLGLCQSNKLDHYYPFALQHQGKNLFDQKRYAEALEYFEKALKLRISVKAPQDQIESTERAIERTRELLFSHRR